MSNFFRYARMPSCIAAIHPRLGGSVWSKLRPGGMWPNPVTGYTGDSEAERLGLITKTNVSTAGAFARINPAVPGTLSVPLDFRGSLSSYTFIIRANIISTSTATTITTLFGQGVLLQGDSTQETFGVGTWVTTSFARMTVRIWFDDGIIKIVNYENPALFDRAVVFAMVIDRPGNAIRCYVDGAQVAQAVINTAAAISTQNTRNPATGTSLRGGSAVGEVLVFNNALPAAEIAKYK